MNSNNCIYRKVIVAIYSGQGNMLVETILKDSIEIGFGFEVIELTFERDGVGYVFPAKSDPVDIVPDVTDPETPEDNFQEGVDDIVDNIKGTWDKFKVSIGNGFNESLKKITAILSVIAVVAVVVIVIKLLPSGRNKDRVEIVVKTDSAHSRKEKRKK